MAETGLERLTFGEQTAEAYFSPDGDQLVFASNRGNERPRETNLFIADWVD